MAGALRFMEAVLYCLARAVLALVWALPWRWAAGLGRCVGGLCYWVDRRHRRVALRNLAQHLGDGGTEAELRAIARENFRRIGESFACAARAAVMTPAAVANLLTFQGLERLGDASGRVTQSRVVAIGHFGCFELYAWVGRFLPGYKFATTYRALRQPALNRLLRRLRTRSGCLYFERRSEMAALQLALRTERLVLGFLADQHAGNRGLPVAFLGEVCSTTAAPAVFALRYGCPLFVAVCYRIGLGRYQIEISEEIPTRCDGQRRTPEEVTRDLNRLLETAVRRDPANWFWVHQRWKPGRCRQAPKAEQ
jgi:KDO2-lipid IV(A) lauroyltransferase